MKRIATLLLLWVAVPTLWSLLGGFELALLAGRQGADPREVLSRLLDELEPRARWLLERRQELLPSGPPPHPLALILLWPFYTRGVMRSRALLRAVVQDIIDHPGPRQ